MARRPPAVVRPIVSTRSPENRRAIASRTFASAQLSAIAGRNLLSGSCGRPSASPEIPTNASTWSYHGARSA
jgi:hypothetical protein